MLQCSHVPMIKHPDQRIGVFVDAQNMYHSARNIYNSRVNFKEVLKQAIAGRKLITAVAYVITSPTKEEASFFDALGKSGFKVKTKDLQIFPGGAKKADWDVGIAMDAIKLSPRLDVVILVSGDGDYVPMVEYLQNHGLQLEVIAFGESSSKSLREVADDFTDLSQDRNRFLLKIK
ncbi:NYN domain-containing protein [Patescibacteria group bacterium]|nr:NYN domain-containing protein [Patescibacteria group bacterium]